MLIPATSGHQLVALTLTISFQSFVSSFSRLSLSRPNQRSTKSRPFFLSPSPSSPLYTPPRHVLSPFSTLHTLFSILLFEFFPSLLFVFSSLLVFPRFSPLSFIHFTAQFLDPSLPPPIRHPPIPAKSFRTVFDFTSHLVQVLGCYLPSRLGPRCWVPSSMPRSSATARKSHSNRQDHGPGGSGKKPSKQKSSGHLNASYNGAATSETGPSSQVDWPSHRSGDQTPTAKVNGPIESSKAESNGRGYLGGYAKGNADMSYGQTNGAAAPNCGLAGHASRRADKSITGTKRTTSNASVNPFQLASTILRSCPMYDTIAILIFLLQLPPMVLTLVQFLFASLTFMPPSGTSAGSFTSNFDIFQGPAGTPSLGTMIAMDGFCLLVWGLFMWTWAQNFALDLAHVQVAITLGGGGAGKNGGVNALCVGIVLILHLIRSKGIQEFVIGHLVSAKIISPDLLSHYSYLMPAEFKRTESQSSPSWMRSLLAVHILAQAGTAMARRSMTKNKTQAPSRSGKRVDTEASAGSQTQIDSAFESAASVSSYLGPDGQVITHKDGRDRLISAKKRRRQANQVRSRQPFWAALASTKVTVMREYEHSRALSKTTKGLTTTEDDLQGVSLDDGLVWITNVDSSTIKFAAGDFASADDISGSGACEAGNLGSDDTEPFYVCVNGAPWATATISKEHDSSKGSNTVYWRGEVSGLAPNCAYTCSFVKSDTDEEICAMSVKTPPANDAEQGKRLIPVVF